MLTKGSHNNKTEETARLLEEEVATEAARGGVAVYGRPAGEQPAEPPEGDAGHYELMYRAELEAEAALGLGGSPVSSPRGAVPRLESPPKVSRESPDDETARLRAENAELRRELEATRDAATTTRTSVFAAHEDAIARALEGRLRDEGFSRALKEALWARLGPDGFVRANDILDVLRSVGVPLRAADVADLCMGLGMDARGRVDGRELLALVDDVADEEAREQDLSFGAYYVPEPPYDQPPPMDGDHPPDVCRCYVESPRWHHDDDVETKPPPPPCREDRVEEWWHHQQPHEGPGCHCNSNDDEIGDERAWRRARDARRRRDNHHCRRGARGLQRRSRDDARRGRQGEEEEDKGDDDWALTRAEASEIIARLRRSSRGWPPGVRPLADVVRRVPPRCVERLYSLVHRDKSRGAQALAEELRTATGRRCDGARLKDVFGAGSRFEFRSACRHLLVGREFPRRWIATKTIDRLFDLVDLDGDGVASTRELLVFARDVGETWTRGAFPNDHDNNSREALVKFEPLVKALVASDNNEQRDESSSSSSTEDQLAFARCVAARLRHTLGDDRRAVDRLRSALAALDRRAGGLRWRDFVDVLRSRGLDRGLSNDDLDRLRAALQNGLDWRGLLDLVQVSDLGDDDHQIARLVHEADEDGDGYLTKAEVHRVFDTLARRRWNPPWKDVDRLCRQLDRKGKGGPSCSDLARLLLGRSCGRRGC